MSTEPKTLSLADQERELAIVLIPPVVAVDDEPEAKPENPLYMGDEDEPEATAEDLFVAGGAEPSDEDEQAAALEADAR